MGTLWFWSFQIVLVLLMLNMLLAIIMDTYTIVKGASANAQTVPEQIFGLANRLRWILRGEGLPLQSIDKKLVEVFGWIPKSELRAVSRGYHFDKDKIVTIDGLAESLDGMETDQAKRLLTQAVQYWRMANLKPLSLSEAMNLISLTYLEVLDQGKHVVQNKQALELLSLKQAATECSMQHAATAPLSNALTDKSAVLKVLDIDQNSKNSGTPGSDTAGIAGDRVCHLELRLEKMEKTMTDKVNSIEKVVNEKMDSVQGSLSKIELQLQTLLFGVTPKAKDATEVNIGMGVMANHAVIPGTVEVEA
jgi:hypothetical protein